jgi:hypothetical protein
MSRDQVIVAKVGSSGRFLSSPSQQANIPFTTAKAAKVEIVFMEQLQVQVA